MKLKSYFSETVEAAMELALKELGEEALLIHSRPATPETRYLGSYEVVFGVPPKSETPPMPLPAPDRLTEDVADLRREVQRMAQSLREARMFTSPAASDEPELYARLLENELDPALAQRVVQGESLETMFEVDAALGKSGTQEGARRIVALIGPPGAGKTTTW
jgi:flagellar biosynthesis GTPase FlhF